MSPEEPRSDTLRALLALLPCAILVVAVAPGDYGVRSGDWAQYMLHARALAEGRSYTDIGYVYTHFNPVIGPRAYPPGTALLIAPFFWLFDDPMPAARVLMVVSAFIWLWLAGSYFARHVGSWTRVSVLLMSGVSISVVGSASLVNSDIPFCVLFWAILLVADRDERWSPARVAALSALGAAAIAFRSIGVALIPGMAVYTLLHYRRQRFLPLVPIVVWSGTFVLVNRLLPVASSYAEQLPIDSPILMVRLFLDNLARYRLVVAEAHLYPFPAGWANDAYHIITFALALVGALIWFSSEWRRLVTWVGIFYFGLLLAFIDVVARYLWPLVPLLVVWLLLGADHLLKRTVSAPAGTRRRWVTVAVIVVVVSSSLLVLLAPASPPLAEMPEFQEVLGWIEAARSADPGVRMMFYLPRPLTWRTGIPSIPLFRASVQETLHELCDQSITHLALGDPGGFQEAELESVETAVASSPSRFVHLGSNDVFQLYAHDLAGCARGRRSGSSS